ncbi:DUF732 domain-containing protein [Mycobacterium sp. SMC-4]|uniref:DUF732 domain-containing protein n=1 Tax=Mycobacterium sp. SMC-4 TaxID=2857059 RepID=UPI003D089109
MRGGRVFGAVAATGAVAVVLAVPAGAEDTDDVFIDAIDTKGIPYSSTADAIDLATAICEYVSAGQPANQVAVEIVGPAGWTAEQSGLFVEAATRSYCPS